MAACFAVLVPLWLFGLIFPPTLVSEAKDELQLASLLWLSCAGLLWGRERFVYGPIWRRAQSFRFWGVVFAAMITASALLSIDPAMSLGYVAVALIGLTSCAGLWFCVRDKMHLSLAAYGLLGSAYMVYIYLDGPLLYGRLSLSEVSHPNYLGVVSFGMLACTFLVRPWALAVPLIAVDVLVILAAQARGPFLAGMVAVVTFCLLSVAHPGKPRRALALAAFAVLGIAFGLMYQHEVSQAAAKLMFLDDRFRGLGTGFTGRTHGWNEGWELFLANPLLGVGFRQHEQYMTVLSSAHNGYLSMLADTGLGGTLSVLALAILSARRLFRQALQGDRLATVGASLLAGFCFLALFERYLINFGNPTSVLVWTFLCMPARQPAVASIPQNANTVSDSRPEILMAGLSSARCR